MQEGGDFADPVLTYVTSFLKTEDQSLLITKLNNFLSSTLEDKDMLMSKANAEQLLLWGERLLDAQNLEEVFTACNFA